MLAETRARKGLATGHDDGRVRRFLDAVWEKEKLSLAEGHAIMNVCMAATYDPDPDGAARLPPAVQPGDGRDARRALEALARARSDPPRRPLPREPALAARASTSTAAGATSTTSTTARGILSERLALAGIRHTYEEFDDNHSDIDYRMNVSLPFLYRALKP